MSKIERREFVKNGLIASAGFTLLPGMLKGKGAISSQSGMKSATVVFYTHHCGNGGCQPGAVEGCGACRER